MAGSAFCIKNRTTSTTIDWFLKHFCAFFFISVDKKTTEQEKNALIYQGSMDITTNSSVKSVFVHLIEIFLHTNVSAKG